jgi:hypothetical protein
MTERVVVIRLSTPKNRPVCHVTEISRESEDLIGMSRCDVLLLLCD